MIISVVNHTNRPDSEIQKAIRAINRQISEDFAPSWNISGSLRLVGQLSSSPDPKLLGANVRGDAIIYLEDEYKKTDPFGFHDINFQGIPFGFVFTELAKQLGEPWEVTFSHEALELLADPEVNRLVMGPHPEDLTRDVFHWYEVCDAVQTERYDIDGVPVSNFVLPLYFTGGEERSGRNDFMGTVTKEGHQLQSFGINPGGYVGFYDPKTNKHDQSFGDESARERSKIKAGFGLARRSERYRDRKGTVERMRGRLTEERLKEVRLIEEQLNDGRLTEERLKEVRLIEEQLNDGRLTEERLEEE